MRANLSAICWRATPGVLACWRDRFNRAQANAPMPRQISAISLNSKIGTQLKIKRRQFQLLAKNYDKQYLVETYSLKGGLEQN